MIFMRTLTAIFISGIAQFGASSGEEQHQESSSSLVDAGSHSRMLVDELVSNYNDYLDGGDDDDDEDDDGGLGIILDILDLFEDDFLQCGLDMSPVLGEDGDPLSLLQLLKLSPPCSTDQTNAMRQVFLDFESCSGYDILELDADALGALVGAVVKCLDAASMIDIATFHLPEQCAVALLGNHPLGKMLRDVLLHPGSTGDCFSKLSNDIPLCTVDLWPFSVDGKKVQMAGCIDARIENVLEEECEEGLEGLQQCLPAEGEMTVVDCDTYSDQCSGTESLFVDLLMLLPTTLQGMPLPDSCKQKGSASGLSEAVSRYEAYRNTCAPTGKALWERLENPEDDSRDPELQTIEEFLRPGGDKSGGGSSNSEGGSSNSEEGSSNGEGGSSDITVGDNPSLVGGAQPATDDNKTSGGGIFGYGMLTGAFLVCLVYGALAIFINKRRRGGKMALPGFVELSLTEGSEDKDGYAYT